MANDRYGAERAQFETNRKRILATQGVCGICGRPVDKTLRFPHPMSATVDHIIPVDKGGALSDMDNLQLAHFACNRQKSDKLFDRKFFDDAPRLVSNRLLPQTFDWHTK